MALPLAVLAVASVYRSIKTLVRRWGTGSARDWPTIGAVIDVVSVAEEIREGRYGTVETTGYKATLTYFYRNPDLQMGEFSRSFPLEGAARQWAEKFKGKNIPVHVNPKDPGDSVLLKDDIEGLGLGSQPTLEDSLRLEELPQLGSTYLVLSGVSEFVALIGLVLTTAAAWIHRHHETPMWLVTTLIVMLLFNSATVWVVSYRADDSNRLQSMLHSYTLFCPTWMRWGVKLTAGLLFIDWVGSDLRDLFPPQVQHWLVMASSYWLYLFAGWVFFSTGATHAAILRSQEFTHRGVVSEAVEVAGKS